MSCLSVDSFLIGVTTVEFYVCSMFCGALLRFLCSFAIILVEKRDLFALLCLSSRCLVNFI